jgi:hypothetical protein
VGAVFCILLYRVLYCIVRLGDEWWVRFRGWDVIGWCGEEGGVIGSERG